MTPSRTSRSKSDARSADVFGAVGMLFEAAAQCVKQSARGSAGRAEICSADISPRQRKTGYVDGSLTLENAHWYGGDGTAAEYAVGYSDSLGIPTSIGSTRHNSVEEFHTLADVLNAGREEPVWEHKGENTLPTLIVRTDFYEAFLEAEN